MKAKRCEICETRPVMPKAAMQREHGVVFPYCEPDLLKSQHENAHEDGDHDTEGCWICHPELDQTREEYRERAGSSRVGVRLTVSLRANGREKATQVADQLDESYATSIRTAKGIVTLKAGSAGTQQFVVRWDRDGHFLGATVTEGEKTRKLRNASEVLRVAA